jgi:hypothetical protein
VQRFQEFDGLAGAQVELVAGGWGFGHDRFGFGHGLIVRRKFLMSCVVVQIVGQTELIVIAAVDNPNDVNPLGLDSKGNHGTFL